METLTLQAASDAQVTTAVNNAGMDRFDIPTWSLSPFIITAAYPVVAA